MKKLDWKPELGGWNIASLMATGILYMNFAGFLLMAFVSVESMVNRIFQLSVTTVLLTLAGLLLFLLGGSGRIQKLWRRMLLAGVLINAVLVIAVFSAFSSMLAGA